MERLLAFRRELKESLSRFSLTDYPVFQDPTRITLSLSPEIRRKAGCAGDIMKHAADWLENNTGVVIEASGSEEMILISTAADSGEDLEYLSESLIRLDREFDGSAGVVHNGKSADRIPSGEGAGKVPGGVETAPLLDSPAERDIYVYPPGIPIVRKGETITKEALNRINKELSAGKTVYGLQVKPKRH